MSAACAGVAVSRVGLVCSPSRLFWHWSGGEYQRDCVAGSRARVWERGRDWPGAVETKRRGGKDAQTAALMLAHVQAVPFSSCSRCSGVG